MSALAQRYPEEEIFKRRIYDSPLTLTMIEWWRIRSSIATVSTPSAAKAVSQLPKLRLP
jgi:hypothetical protein